MPLVSSLHSIYKGGWAFIGKWNTTLLRLKGYILKEQKQFHLPGSEFFSPSTSVET